MTRRFALVPVCAWLVLGACTREEREAPTVPWGGRFERATSFDEALARVSAELAEEGQSYALSVDMDADGLRDVIVTLPPPSGPPRSFLVRQAEPGRFSPAEPLPYDRAGCLAATDLDGDGRIDLLFADPPLAVAWGTDAGIVVTGDAPPHPWTHAAIEQVLPQDLDGDGRLDLVVSTWDRDYLLYGEPDGTFAEVSLAQGWTFAYCPFDFDRDGRTDLYNMTEGLARADNENEALRNVGARTWERFVPVDAAEDGRHYFTPAGVDGAVKGTPMSCAWADILGDATPELFLAQDSCNSPLYALDAAAGVWRDTRVSGLGGRCLDEFEVFWGASFADMDADGRPDLVVSAGNDFGTAERTGVRGASRLHVYRNVGEGRFTRADPAAYGLDEPGDFQSMLAEDIDGDGYPDLLVGGFAEPPRLYWNRLEPRGNPLSVTLVGAAVDGTRIDVEADGVRSTRHAGRESAMWRVTGDTTLLVGLGAAREATVTVHWPDGPAVHRLTAGPTSWRLTRP